MYLPAYQPCVVPIPAYQILYITPCISTSGSEWLFTSMSTLCIYLALTAQVTCFINTGIHKHPLFVVLHTNICSSSHKQAHSVTAAISIWQLVTKSVYILATFSGGQVVTSGLSKDRQVIDVPLRSAVLQCRDAPNETKSVQLSYFSKPSAIRNFKVWYKYIHLQIF